MSDAAADAPARRPPRGGRTSTVVLLGLGAAAGVIAWTLPATQPGAATTPALAHAVFPVVGFALCLTAAWRIAAGLTPAGWGAARLCAYALGLAIVVHVLRLSPLRPATFMLALDVALALAAGLLLSGPRLRPRLPRSVLHAADLALGLSLFMAAGAEATLRVMATSQPRPAFSQRDEGPRTRLAKFRPPPGALRFGFPVGADGFVDDPAPPQAAPVVAVLGDAALWGHVPHELAPSTVAEQQWPGAAFLDLAVRGTGPLEQRIVLEDDALPRRPDAVLLAFDVTDDLGDVDRRRDVWWPLAMLVDRGNVLLTVLYDRYRRGIAQGPPPAPPEQLPWASPELLPPRDLDVPVAQALPWTADPALERPPIPPAELQRRLRRRLDDAWGTGAGARLDRAVDAVAALRDRCRHAGVPFGVLLLPAVDQLPGARAELAASLRPADAPDRPIQTELGARLAAYGIPTLDALPALRAARPWHDGRLHLFHTGATGLNSRGARLVGGLLQAHARRLLSGDGTDEQR